MTAYRGRPRALLTAMMGCVLVTGGVAGCGSSTPTSQGPSPTPAATTPAPPPVDNPGCLKDGEKVTRFPGGDGTLPGVVLGTGAVGVIFAHQTDGGMCQWIITAREFSAKGYRAMVFDFAGHRLAEKTTSPTTTADVVSAAAYLKTVGVTGVVLIGASFGGGAVVTAAATPGLPVVAVVSLSGTNTMRTTEPAVDASARLKAPLLCAAGKRDSGGDYARDAEKMCPANGPGPRQLLLLDGGEHGVRLYAKAEVKAAVADFVAKYAPAG